jgi:hypothetical protein
MVTVAPAPPCPGTAFGTVVTPPVKLVAVSPSLLLMIPRSSTASVGWTGGGLAAPRRNSDKNCSVFEVFGTLAAGARGLDDDDNDDDAVATLGWDTVGPLLSMTDWESGSIVVVIIELEEKGNFCSGCLWSLSIDTSTRGAESFTVGVLPPWSSSATSPCRVGGAFFAYLGMILGDGSFLSVQWTIRGVYLGR